MIEEGKILWLGNASVSIMSFKKISFEEDKVIVRTEKLLGLFGSDMEKSIPRLYFDLQPKKWYRKGKLEEKAMYIANYDLFTDSPYMADYTQPYLIEAQTWKKKYDDLMREFETYRKEHEISGRTDKVKEEMLRQTRMVKQIRGDLGMMSPSDYYAQKGER